MTHDTTPAEAVIVCGICGSADECLKTTSGGICLVDYSLWRMCQQMEDDDEISTR